MTNPPLSGKEPRLSANDDAPLTSNEPALSLERLLPGFRESFTSTDRATRTRLIDELTSGSEGAVIALLQLLRGSTDTRTRQRCIALLGQLGDQRAVPALIEMLDAPDLALRRVAVWALGQLRALDAVDPLVRVLDRESDHRILMAALHSIGEIIGHITDIKLLPLMFKLSEHPHPLVVKEAQSAMWHLAITCPLPDLIPWLHVDQATQRQWAATCFVHSPLAHHPNAPTEREIPLLERLLDYPENAEVQYVAFMKLSETNDDRAHRRIIEFLRHPDLQIQTGAIRLAARFRLSEAADTLFALFAENSLDDVRLLMEAIAQMNDPRVIPFLLDQAETDEGWHARSALPPRSLDALIARLKHSEGEARINLLRALDTFDAPLAWKTLLDVARTSPNAEERRLAITQLHLSDHPEWFRQIAAILFTDPDPDVKSAAIWKIRCASENPQTVSTLRAFLHQTTDDALRAEALAALFSNRVPDAKSMLETELARKPNEEALITLLRWFELLVDQSTPLKLTLYEQAQNVELRKDLVGLNNEEFADEQMINLVLHALKHDPDPDVRQAALSNFYWPIPTDDRIIGAVMDALNDDGCYRHDEYEYTISSAAAGCLHSVDRPDVQAAVAAYRARHPHGDDESS